MEFEKCKRCGYKWSPRVLDPTSCPKCKRYDWNEDIINNEKGGDKD